MARKLVFISAFVLVVLSAAGCGSHANSGGISGLSPDQARQMNGERSAFETSEDPPINARTHFAAALVAESHNDWGTAVKQYRQVLKLAPAHRESLYRLGVCLSHLKKYPEAVRAWEEYVEATGGSAGAYSNLGFCHELAGQIDGAEAAYRQGIERDPRNVPCRTNYGLMLARVGRTAEAAMQLQAVLSEAEVHYNLGSVLESQGRREGAKAEYRKALAVDPDFTDAQVRLAGLD